MAIIYSYPTVTPTANDLVLGTDVDQADKPTKNFTVQSIIDLVTVSGNDLQAVLDNGNVATGKDVNITNNAFRGGSFVTSLNALISGTQAAGFSLVTSTDFAGNLTGVIKNGSSIQSLVTGVTQNQGDNSTKLATTAYVDNKVDPSVLQYLGDSTGPFSLNLINDDFKIAGTTNQIETTATTVAGNVGTITLKFPTAGVVLPNGSTATTQAASDNTTKVATTQFVHNHGANQDLDFEGDTGSGSVLLDSQTLDLEGTANQITTQASGQKVTFSLPSSVTIAGTYTGATFAGDLLGTVNTATTGVTQNAGDNSTKIATTAYVDTAAGAKTLDYAGDATGPFALNLSTDDLELNGDSNITVTAAAVAANKGIITIDLNNNVDISGTMTAGTFTDGTFTGSSGTYTGYTSITSTAFVGALTGNASTATALQTSGAIALTGDTVSTGGPYTYTSGGALSIATTIADTTVTGKVLTNLPTPTSSAIAASDTILAAMAKLQGQITSTTGLAYEGTWDASGTGGGNPDLTQASRKVNGHFYIVSVAGNAEPNGGSGTQLSPWAVGDWCIYVANGSATDEWQKLDQSNEVLGSGTANKLAKWTATNTLGTGLIEDNGTTVTVGNSGNLVVQGNTTLGDADTDTTTVKGPAEFEETLRANVGISLGNNNYGNAGQVLTSGGGAASVNTWTTPTVGTVTGVTGLYGITVGGTSAVPTVAITEDANNLINQATAKATPVGNDSILINDSAATNVLKKSTISSLPFDEYTSWTLAGDSGSSQTISSGNTATIAGGTGINTAASATDTVTVSIDYAGNDNAIEAAADGTSITIAGTDKLWVSDATDNTIKQINASQIKTFSDQDLSSVLAVGNTTGSTNIVVQKSIQLPKTTTNTGTPTDQGVLSFGGNFQNGNRIFNDASGGTLRIQASSNLNIDAQNFLFQNTNGSLLAGGDTGVRLYYQNSEKLTTTTSGVTVTGNTLTNSAASSDTYQGLSTGTSSFIILANSGGNAFAGSTNGSYLIYSGGNASSTTGAGSTVALTIDANQNIKFDDYGSGSNTGTPTFNLEVDSSGNIIETPSLNPGGKGGVYTGNKSFTGGAAAATLFRLTRGTTGALVFDVYLTSGTSQYSVKKFTVAHILNTDPTFNKIIDSGFTTNGDYTVAFVNDGQGVSGDTVKCTIAATTTQDIYYTIVVGHGATAVTRHTS